MPRTSSLLVAALVLVAGCAGTPPGAGPTTTPNGTDTTTGTPSTGTTGPVPNGTLAPGVTDEGVTNLSALLDAHADAVRERGVELAVERRFSDGNATRRIERRAVATPDFRRLRERTTGTLTGNRSVRRGWADASMERLLVRLDARGETRYLAPPLGSAGSDARAARSARLVGTERLTALLRGGEFAVTGANGTADGRRYTLRATNFSDGDRYGEREARLVVDGDGVIRAASVSGDLADGGSFAFDYRVVRLGVDAVERPDWVAAAPEPVDARPTAGFENCSRPYLTVDNPGPDALPADTRVTVRLNGTEHRAGLDTPLPAGERRALYLDASGTLRTAAVDAVPANRTAMPNDAGVTVTTAEGLVLLRAGLGFGCATAGAGESGGGDGG